MLEDMLAAVTRADAVVRGLLDLSRVQELVLKENDLNEVVRNTLALVKHDSTVHHVRLVLDLEQGTLPVTMDRLRIQQVLINLMTNAIHAMEGGGTLTVRTRRAEIPLAVGGPGEGTPPAHARTDGVVIIIEDTGPGIPPDALDRIFEPFFTTKGAERGTGLGLPVSRQLVRMHRGSLTLDNMDHGARATVQLPLQLEGGDGVRHEAHSIG